MKHDCLNIVMATDGNYIEFVATCLCSIMDNNHSYENVRLFLLINEVNSKALQQFEASVSVYNGLSVKYIDISNLKELIGIAVPETIALTSYARLFVGVLLPNDVENVLYLDCDIIVTSDLGELKDIVGDKSVYGVLDILPDAKSKLAIGNEYDSIYVNAGVLLINLNKWREKALHKLFLEFLISHEGNVHHHDQGIINAVCKNDIGLLHPKYNVHSSYFSHPFSLIKKANHPFYPETEYNDARKYAVIVHFTTGFFNRPWMLNSKHPLRHEFDRYHRMTEWRDKPYCKDDRTVLVRVLSWEFLNMPLFCYDMSCWFINVLKRIIRK